MLSVLRILLLLVIVLLESAIVSPQMGMGHPGMYHSCPDLYLRNGRVRLRSRGRIAKFICRTGYRLYGRGYVTCLRNKWNYEPPICISNSGKDCDVISHPTNGRMSAEMRGAILRFTCNPGYTLVGSPLLYCSGMSWNSTAPVCKSTINNPALSCDFERSDMCGWSHDSFDDFDWRRFTSSTSSGHIGTGPSFDHTLGQGRNGYYVYIEASFPRKENDTARLFSPVYPAEFSNNSCFQFWYHMYGLGTGGLNVYVKPESRDITELIPVYSKYGNQGNEWLQGLAETPNTMEAFQIVIEGIRGNEYTSDIAVDDVKLTVGQSCDSFATTTLGAIGLNETETVVTLASSSVTSAVPITSASPMLQATTMSVSGTGSSPVMPTLAPVVPNSSVTKVSLAVTVTSASGSKSDPSSAASPTRPSVIGLPGPFTKSPIRPAFTVRYTNAAPIPSLASLPPVAVLTTRRVTALVSGKTSLPPTIPTSVVSSKATASQSVKPQTRTSSILSSSLSPLSSLAPKATIMIGTPSAQAPLKRTTAMKQPVRITVPVPTTRPTTTRPTTTTTRPTTTTTRPTTTTTRPTTTTTRPTTPTTKRPTTTSSTTIIPTRSVISTSLASQRTTKVPVPPIVIKTLKPMQFPNITLKPFLSITTVTIPTTRLPITVDQSATSASTLTSESVTEGTLPNGTMSNRIPLVEHSGGPVLPPWVYLNRSEWQVGDPDSNKVHVLAPQAHTAGTVVSVPMAIGIAAVAVVAVIVVAVVARGIYRRRRVWRDSLNEDSDVRYLKDCEVRVEFLDRNFRSGEDGL